MIFLLQNNNLLFGFLPESMAILFFGVALIAVAIGMRWFLSKIENNVFEVKEPVRNFTPSQIRCEEFGDAQLGVSGK
ncbi:MAG: hypothetical protein R2681_00170 [Pyrinomonadaceae bacterium]